MDKVLPVTDFNSEMDNLPMQRALLAGHLWEQCPLSRGSVKGIWFYYVDECGAEMWCRLEGIIQCLTSSSFLSKTGVFRYSMYEVKLTICRVVKPGREFVHWNTGGNMKNIFERALKYYGRKFGE